MVKLIMLLANGIPAVIGSIILFIARKFSTATATIAAFIFLTAALIVCIKTAVIYVVTLIVIPTWVGNAIGMFIPGDFFLVLSSIIGAKTCRAAYDLAMLKVRAINSSN